MKKTGHAMTFASYARIGLRAATAFIHALALGGTGVPAVATYSSLARPRAISQARTSRSPRTGGIAPKMSTTQCGARETSIFLEPRGRASALAPQTPMPSSRSLSAPPDQRPPSLAHIEAVASRTGSSLLLKSSLPSTRSECPWGLRSARSGVPPSRLDHLTWRDTCSSSSVLRTATRRSRLGVGSSRFAPSHECAPTTVA